MLNANGVEATGLDPTQAPLAEARNRDRDGRYVEGRAEMLPFADESFDLVVSYLTLIDIPDVAAAIAEMTRVLKRPGRLLIANLNGFNTAGQELDWSRDEAGNKQHFRIDNYLTESAAWIDYRGIRIRNHHRPLSTYMRLLLENNLALEHFDEPRPAKDAPAARARDYIRAPWFLVMEWRKG